MLKSLEPVRVFAEAKAPRKSGYLKTKVSKGTRTRPRARKKSDVEVYVGVEAGTRSAIPQEFGTIRHGAQPFMRPAWDANKFTVLVKFREELWEQIMKSIARQERKAARDAAKLKSGA